MATAHSVDNALRSWWQDVQKWQLLGAAVWQAAVLLIAIAAWGLPAWLSPLRALSAAISPRLWLITMLLCLVQAPVLLAQFLLLEPSEPAPLSLSLLGLSLPGKFWQTLSRALGRLTDLSQLAKVFLLFVACAASGTTFLFLYSYMRGARVGFAWCALFGTVLGFVYAAFYLYRADNAISFPVIQRHRYFRLKQRIPAAFITALYVTLPAFAASLVLRYLETETLGLNSWRALGTQFLGALLCAFLWSTGSELLRIIFTERLQFVAAGEPNPNRPLLEALQNSKDPLMQELAFHDLAALAEASGKGGWRRRAIFADDSGATWTAIARSCLDEVEGLVGVIKDALPQSQGRAVEGVNRPPLVGVPTPARWNALPLATATKGPAASTAASRAADAARWYLHAHRQRAAHALRALAALCCASRREDALGIIQLAPPRLGAVARDLAAAALALQHYVKQAVPPVQRHSGVAVTVRQAGGAAAGSGAFSNEAAEGVARALAETAISAVYGLQETFGATLHTALTDADRAPLFGSAVELEALLTSCAAHQE